MVVVFGLALPHIASYEEAASRLRNLSDGETAVVLGVAAWNLASYWFLLTASLPGLRLWQAGLASTASTAVSNTLPAGGAAGIGVTVSMYRAWGFPRESITRALVVSGAWNVFVKLALPLVAVVLVTWWGDGHPPVGIGVVSLAVLASMIAAFASVLRGAAISRRVGGAERLATRLARRPVTGWVDAITRFQRASSELVARRWARLSIAAAVSHLSLFAVLATTVWALDVPGVSMVEAFVAFAVVRVALVLPLTPGGAGLAELGLAGILVGAGGADAEVVAAILVFRALTWALPIPLGGLAYAIWLWQRRRP